MFKGLKKILCMFKVWVFMLQEKPSIWLFLRRKKFKWKLMLAFICVIVWLCHAFIAKEKIVPRTTYFFTFMNISRNVILQQMYFVFVSRFLLYFNSVIHWKSLTKLTWIWWWYLNKVFSNYRAISVYEKLKRLSFLLTMLGRINLNNYEAESN